MHGQCDTRPTATFPAVGHHGPVYTTWWQRRVCANNLPNYYTTKPYNSTFSSAQSPSLLSSLFSLLYSTSPCAVPSTILIPLPSHSFPPIPLPLKFSYRDAFASSLRGRDVSLVCRAAGSVDTDQSSMSDSASITRPHRRMTTDTWPTDRCRRRHHLYRMVG